MNGQESLKVTDSWMHRSIYHMLDPQVNGRLPVDQHQHVINQGELVFMINMKYDSSSPC